MQEIGGAVKRVDDPKIFGIAVLQAGLLGEDVMLWIRLFEYLYYRLLCRAINLRHIIVLRLLFDGQFVEVKRRPVDNGASAARGFDRDIEYWMHGKLSVRAFLRALKSLRRDILQ
jgi:hypothetical protein